MITVKKSKPVYCGGCGATEHEAELMEITMSAAGHRAKRIFVCCTQCMESLNGVMTEFLKNEKESEGKKWVHSAALEV